MNSALFSILMWIIALNVFALGVLVLFLVNARINLKRNILQQRLYLRAYNLALSAKTSEEAAQYLGITKEEYQQFCRQKGIETPEEREVRVEEEHNQKEAEQQRILEEEAAWRSEQERILEERRKAQEEEAKKRKERLRKFGFK